jgi:hypothetical protein
MHIIFLQAGMALGMVLIFVLGAALIIGVPTLVFLAKKKNKMYESYSTFDKFTFTFMMTVLSILLVGGIIISLFSMIRLDIS